MRTLKRKKKKMKLIVNEEKSIFKDSENLKNEKNIVFSQDKQPQPEKNTKLNNKLDNLKNQGRILAPNTGFLKTENNNFVLNLILLAIFEVVILIKRKFLNEDF